LFGRIVCEPGRTGSPGDYLQSQLPGFFNTPRAPQTRLGVSRASLGRLRHLPHSAATASKIKLVRIFRAAERAHFPVEQIEFCANGLMLLIGGVALPLLYVRDGHLPSLGGAEHGLLQLIDHEVRSTSILICTFEQIRHLVSDLDDALELLLGHYNRLCSIQKLALSFHEASIRNSPPL
jgi:hypothetical protein